MSGMIDVNKLRPSMQNIMLARLVLANASHDAKRDAGVHTMDANDLTAMFAREFEFIDQNIRETKYAPLQSENFVQWYAAGGPSVDTVTWRQVTELGQAEWIGNRSDDLPRVDVVGDELSENVQNMGVAWGFNIFDMLKAQSRPSIQLEKWKKASAFNASRRKHDTACMVGDAGFGWTGLVNDANIPLVSPITGGWATATALQMVADINRLTWTVYNNSYGYWTPSVLLVPDSLGEVMDTPIGTDANKTVASYILKNSRHIDKIEFTHHLNTANVAGTGPRVMVYPGDSSGKASSEVMQYGANSVFTELAPQPKGLEVIINCWGRSSGLHLHEPLACGYMDVD